MLGDDPVLGVWYFGIGDYPRGRGFGFIIVLFRVDSTCYSVGTGSLRYTANQSRFKFKFRNILINSLS